MAIRNLVQQSGAIPYRFADGDLQVMLVTSRRGGKWILPKGQIERGMSAADSAAKEAAEEAGVLGEIAPRMAGAYTYEKRDATCKVLLYPLHVRTVLREWQESDMRERQWFRIDKAVESIDDESIRRVVEQFARTVQGN